MANECEKAEAFLHRWKIDKVATLNVSNAIPRLESGEYLPRLYFEVVLTCTECGAQLWYDHVNAVDVQEFSFYPAK